MLFPKWPRPIGAIVLIVALSIFLGSITWLAEFATLSGTTETLVHLLYRPVYILMAPFHYLTRLIDFPDDRHWPVWQLPAVALATSIFYTLVLIAGRRMAGVLIHGGTRTGQEETDYNLDRRRFLVRAAGGTAALAGAATGAQASFITPQRLTVARYDAPIRDLPGPLAGLKIVHVSDTHFGPFISLGYLENMVRQVNALQPDFIALTGDYTHRSPRTIEPGIGLLAGLRARLGTAAVLGNHDHWEGAAACRARFESIGIPLVDNARLFLGPDGLRATPGEAAICVGGLGDYWEDLTAFDRALDGVREYMPRIVLAHNPDTAEEDANGRRIDLMLSGHTHGGQIAVPVRGPLMTPSLYGIKYAGGWVEGPQCPVIVSRGVGMTVMPIRFGVPPEIGVVTLRQSDSGPAARI